MPLTQLIENQDDAIYDSVILLVDDTNFNLELLKEVIRIRGFHNIVTARNGQEALDKYHSEQPDAIVLDLMMPVMDGFEFCKAIRNDIGDKGLPIVVQTALTSMKERQEAFKVGASDLVTKPVNPDELVSRLKVHLSLRNMMKNLRQYRTAMQYEMNSARDMQCKLLPSENVVKNIQADYKISIKQLFQPSIEIGGDVWGAIPIDERYCAFYMTDFSGHGVTAAINTFRFHTILTRLKNLAEPSEVLGALNKELCEMLPTGQFATMFYGVFDKKELCLRVGTASAPAMMIKKLDGTVELIKSTGFALGVMANAEYECEVYPLAMGESLVMYSDALIETENMQGKLYTEELLHETLADAAYDPADVAAAEGLHHAIIAEYNQYLGVREHPCDDLTLVVLKHSA